MDTCSRRCHRRITLTSATLITPASPAQGPSGNGDYTWVKFRCKYLLQAGQDSVQFNTQACLNQEAGCGGGSLINRRLLRSESVWLSYCCSRLACSPLSRCYSRGWKYLWKV